MSKLLDTLEKIRKNEEQSFSTEGERSFSPAEPAQKNNSKVVMIVVVFAIIAISVYATLPYTTQYIKTSNQNAPAPIEIVQSLKKEPIRTSPPP